MSATCRKITCCGEDAAFGNYSSDRVGGSSALYTGLFNAYVRPPIGNVGDWSCFQICTSLASQAAADDCARRQATQCVIETKWSQTPTRYAGFLNQRQVCTKSCSDGTLFTYQVAAGTFAAATQAIANAMAYARACYMADQVKLCMNDIPNVCCLQQEFEFDLVISGANELILVDGITPVSWFVAGGNLPPGVDLVDSNPFDNTAKLIGTPITPGIWTFTIDAIDFDGHTVSKTATITALELTPATLPNPELGVPYSQQLTADGGSGDYTFELESGDLPDGLSLSEDGLISGTPTVEDGYEFTIKITDNG